jgi:hypothetical protein
MINLLEETLLELRQQNKTVSDVRWIGATNYGYATWDDFAKVANVRYDNGFGAQEVASDLVIVGDDWWLERYEYDGSESWDYKTIPTKPEKRITLTRVARGSWSELKELQKDDEL